ncbi:MAG: TonB-dependent receptor, partial [Pseudomonadota bacterium]
VDALVFLGSRQLNDDLVSGNGAIIPFSEFDQFTGLFKIGFEPTDEMRVEFIYTGYHDTALVPANSEDDPGPTNPVVDRDGDVNSYRLSFDYAPSAAPFLDMSALFYFNSLEITEFRVPPGAPRLDKTTYETIGLEVVNRSRFGDTVPVELVYGFEVFEDSQDGIRDGAPRLSFPDAKATTIGLFAEATIGLSQTVDLIAGLRYDNYERDPNSATLPKVTKDFWSPRIGISYRPNDNWQLYGNIARAFRAPSLSELYNSGLHFAGGPFGFPPDNFFVPNPNLEPEESTQYEIGVRHENTGLFQDDDRIGFSANVYFADVDNFIEQTVDIFAGTTTSRNVPRATLWGLEAEIDYDAGTWYIGGGLGIARGEDNAGGDLASIPQDRLTIEGGVRPRQDWTFGARVTLADRQSRVPAGTAPGPGFELLDLYASYLPQSGALDGAEIRFGIDNVFDEQYTIYPNGLAQPGRTFKMSAAFTF